MRNVGLKYVCKPVQVRVENADTPFTNACRKGEVLGIQSVTWRATISAMGRRWKN